jgi:succinylarginine dihydrolase
LPLTTGSLATLPAGLLLNEERLSAIEGWVDRHYRPTLSRADLADPLLVDEWNNAMADLPTFLR